MAGVERELRARRAASRFADKPRPDFDDPRLSTRGQRQARRFHNQSFQMQNVVIQAASAYWNLALVRETVRVARDAFGRTEALLKWHDKRVNNGLADKADLLQAEAALQTSRINLQTALNNETL